MSYLMLCQVFILPHLLLIGSKIYFSKLFGAGLLAVGFNELGHVLVKLCNGLCRPKNVLKPGYYSGWFPRQEDLS